MTREKEGEGEEETESESGRGKRKVFSLQVNIDKACVLGVCSSNKWPVVKLMNA